MCFFACWKWNPGSDFDKDDEALTVNDDDFGAKLVLFGRLFCCSGLFWKFARLDVRKSDDSKGGKNVHLPSDVAVDQTDRGFIARQRRLCIVIISCSRQLPRLERELKGDE